MHKSTTFNYSAICLFDIKYQQNSKRKYDTISIFIKAYQTRASSILQKWEEKSRHRYTQSNSTDADIVFGHRLSTDPSH